MQTPIIILVATAFSGVATHVFIFNHGEWHMQAPLIFRFYSTVAFIFTIFSLFKDGVQGASTSSAVIFIYGLSFFASVGFYRVALHRLRKFPGPFWASISKFWHVAKCIGSSSQNHKVLDKLHKKYGDFVRTGPTEVTIFHPDVFNVMDGPGNHCTKAVWYDFLLPEVAVNTTRDKPLHDQRRRIWDSGFNTKALAQYQQRIAHFATHMDEHIEDCAKTNEAVDIADWVYWYSFDVMGEFAFARSFDMLRDKKWHHAILLLRRAMSLLGPLSPVPWLAQIGFWLIPNFWRVKDWNTMMKWCKTRMEERIGMKPERPDVSSYLIDASAKKGTLEQDKHWLNGDSIAIIIAGSDTVAPTLVFLLYEFAKDPKQAEKLCEELRNIDYTNHEELKKCQHLNGAINEALRIHPPVPSGGYRETPPQGVTIGSTYIPGGTTIVAPRYTIGRLESCFEKANEFIPERWYEKPDMIRNRKAFMPFSQGRYSCVGKNLAMAELRYVTAMLVSKYHVRFAQGEDGSRVEGEMRDQFTASPGPMRLVFQMRE